MQCTTIYSAKGHEKKTRLGPPPKLALVNDARWPAMNVRNVHASTGVSFSLRTVYRVLHNYELMEFEHHKPRPKLEPHHGKKRTQWAKKMTWWSMQR